MPVSEVMKPTGESTHPPRKDTNKRWIIENLVSLGVALLIVFMIRSSVVEAFKIPSGSMIPTLLTGDHIFVNKFAYGFKIPFSDLFSSEPTYLIRRAPPKRGDIVVFKYPKNESIYFIKRVIGVAGDTLELRNKTLLINRQEVAHTAFPAEAAAKLFKSFQDPKYASSSLEIYEEHLPQKDHLIMLDHLGFSADTFGPVTVPENSLFVMGDNRDFSNDSRFWGFVPMNNVKGKAMVIWLSLWVSFSDGQFIFRPDRIGTLLN